MKAIAKRRLTDHAVVAGGVQLHATAVYKVVADEQQLASHRPKLQRRRLRRSIGRRRQQARKRALKQRAAPHRGRRRVECRVQRDGAVARSYHADNAPPLPTPRPRQDLHCVARLPALQRGRGAVRLEVPTNVSPAHILAERQLAPVDTRRGSVKATVVTSIESKALAAADLRLRVRPLVLRRVCVEEAARAWEWTLTIAAATTSA